MSIDKQILANREAVGHLLEVTQHARDNWTTPRAHNKWSPAQVVEHVARSFDEGAKLVAGEDNILPTMPSFARPLMRMFFFDRIIKKGKFPTVKTVDPLDPESGPDSPEAAADRINASLERFVASCQACANKGGDVNSGAFGKVSVEDYANFMALHTVHHTAQIPTA